VAGGGAMDVAAQGATQPDPATLDPKSLILLACGLREVGNVGVSTDVDELKTLNTEH